MREMDCLRDCVGWLCVSALLSMLLGAGGALGEELEFEWSRGGSILESCVPSPLASSNVLEYESIMRRAFGDYHVESARGKLVAGCRCYPDNQQLSEYEMWLFLPDSGNALLVLRIARENLGYLMTSRRKRQQDDVDTYEVEIPRSLAKRIGDLWTEQLGNDSFRPAHGPCLHGVSYVFFRGENTCAKIVCPTKPLAFVGGAMLEASARMYRLATCGQDKEQRRRALEELRVLLD